MNQKSPFLLLKNNAPAVDLADITEFEYDEFSQKLSQLMSDESNHLIIYYAVPYKHQLLFICAVGIDIQQEIAVFSHILPHSEKSIQSLTPTIPQLHIFEREISENFGIQFIGHPWMKPVRYNYDRSNKADIMDNYPFYSIESEELHEVGVGPIHAGVIEPGHFRFICNGEKVLHLEIHLGYQHRGVESQFIALKKPLQRMLLAESIAGDTTIGHGLAHVQLMESLAQKEVSVKLQLERAIALELERVAIHIGDTAALCTDVAYQLGQVVNEALRTTIINTTQLWCGNRFGKGLIRPFGSNYPLIKECIDAMLKTLHDSGHRYMDITDRMYTLPSLLMRFDGNGVVTKDQALKIGAVGMAARTSGIARDVRATHPFQGFNHFHYTPVTRSAGDVLSRGMLRNIEVRHSIKVIQEMIEQIQSMPDQIMKPNLQKLFKPNAFAISLTEGWRGEICHCAITDEHGDLMHYKVKDPSMHNWMALALAVRNQEISDFPINNKSFNLSYCGFDL